MAAPKAKYPNIAYTKELIKRIEDSIKAIEKAEITSDISKQERLIVPVLKEIQMACPRIWDDVRLATKNTKMRLLEEV